MPADPPVAEATVPLADEPPERYAYPCALHLPPAAGARWTAEAPDLAECRSEGDGARDCIANIVDAVEAWVTAAHGRGEPLPEASALDALARQPAFAKSLWLLVVRRDKRDDLAVSKALAEAGALPAASELPLDIEAPAPRPAVSSDQAQPPEARERSGFSAPRAGGAA